MSKNEPKLTLTVKQDRPLGYYGVLDALLIADGAILLFC